MKILIDENLSPKLAINLADLFPHLYHVTDLGLKTQPDTQIWNFARQNGFESILTADEDFQKRALQLGPPPKFIRIERCDFSTREITDLLRRQAIRIADFLESRSPLLVLRR